MKKVLFLIVLASICGTASAQVSYINYFLLIDSARYLQQQKQYKEAVVVYKKAFQQNNARSADLLELSSCYIELKNDKKAYKYAKQSILAGTPLRYIQTLKRLSTYESDLWQKIEKHYKQYRATFLASIDIENYIELQLIKAEDQSIREGLMMQASFFENEDLMNYAKHIDSLNIERLLTIINRHEGWPGIRSYGDAESAGFYTLLHLSEASFYHPATYDSIYTQLYEVAKQGVISGELSPFQFAYWVDYSLRSTDNKQRYGVALANGWQDIPFEDIENVDQLRQEIGLPPLYKQCARSNSALPELYIMPKTNQ